MLPNSIKGATTELSATHKAAKAGSDALLKAMLAYYEKHKKP